MKLLLLTPFWRPVTGGVGRFVEALRDRLLASGHRGSVIALSGDATEGVTTFSPSTAGGLGAALTQTHPERAGGNSCPRALAAPSSCDLPQAASSWAESHLHLSHHDAHPRSEASSVPIPPEPV